jgi:hypothetical protein
MYFNWLCAKVISVTSTDPFHWNLLKTLHSTEFVWVIPGDRHRAEDGMELRSHYLRESGMQEDSGVDHGCSVLEMLVAFSKRAWFQTDTPASEWFWEFLDNLDLSGMTDDVRTDPNRIDDILERFVWRTYKYGGRGGILPLRNPHRDQRKLEIWAQFFDYLEDTGRLL